MSIFMLFHGYVASSSVLKRIVFFYFVTEKSIMSSYGWCLFTGKSC
jgi:hypothetical protein